MLQVSPDRIAAKSDEIRVRIGKTVKCHAALSRPENQGDSSLSSENEDTNESNSKMSRRDFLKYSAGVAAVAAGASAVLGKLPLPSSDASRAPPTRSATFGPIVVAVNGDELTVMSGHREVKVKDPVLAAEIASRAQ